MARPWWSPLLLLCLLGLVAALPAPAVACTTTQAPRSGQDFLFDITEDGAPLVTIDSTWDVGQHRQPRCISASDIGTVPDPDPKPDGPWFSWDQATYHLPTRTGYHTALHVTVHRGGHTLFLPDGDHVRVVLAEAKGVREWPAAPAGSAQAAFDGNGLLVQDLAADPPVFSVLQPLFGWTVREAATTLVAEGQLQLLAANEDWFLFATDAGHVAFEVAAAQAYPVAAPAGTGVPWLDGEHAVFPTDDAGRRVRVEVRTGATQDEAYVGPDEPVYDAATRTGAPLQRPHPWPVVDALGPLPARTWTHSCACPDDTTTTTGPPSCSCPQDLTTPPGGTASPSGGKKDGILEVPVTYALALLAPAAAAWAIRRRL